ncbi:MULTISPECIES: tRNA glutamyl-Q(34) synthetase GluQRS [Thalassobacter]|uniref:tRNA glutamyl-Q(34) synthetase GluQRS n=1 Tax=Thalassobacter TaxID=266808 RepID=UPI00051D9E3B|nr:MULTISPECIES: tRNA glutamyl-Q(34) synthetase GluQRS [Thalassobacter]KGL02990.1 glutamyl-tRNA synthetase [Thalassobacter sp. 16PALIMAR09]
MTRTRFAPSPTGPLHLGHAYAALIAAHRGNEMLLRIEDIDATRARPQWEAAIHDDLAWLGVTYPMPVMRQSDRHAAYGAALDALWSRGLLYPCTCTRRDIEAAASAPQEGAPLLGPDGMIYPGTCRHTPAGPRPKGVTLRLNMAKATAEVGPVSFTETGAGPGDETGVITVLPDDMVSAIGDIVVARKDFGTSYHLSVVVDDAAQEITEATRGTDLFEATPIHVLLQRLLDLPTPQYHHHGLIRDPNGKRLAKRDDARALRVYRDGGWDGRALAQRLMASPQTAAMIPTSATS